MRISINKVKDFENSSLIAGFEEIIKEALASKDERRIKAANRIQENVSNLNAFLSLCKQWKTRRGCYIVPLSHLGLAKKINIFIGKETLLNKIIYRGNNGTAN